MDTTRNEMKTEVTVTFMMSSGNPFDHKKKTEVLQKFARLDMEDQVKLEKLIDGTSIKSELTKKADHLNSEDKARVLEIINNPKALAALKQYWSMLKTMFG